jgi:hypothetical protein
MRINLEVIIVILIILILYCDYYFGSKKEYMVNIKPINNPSWNRICKYSKAPEPFDKILKKYNIPKSTNNISDIQFPCNYDNINYEINNMEIHNDKRAFIIDNADEVAGKNYLWNNLVKYYGLEKAKTIMPNTYILYSKYDINRLKKDYNKNKLYIMKKNIQKQKGLHITNSINEILHNDSSYVVVQELLQDPYTINGRKINMRFYVLVICNNNNLDVYVYNNGFMYYTKKKYIKNSKNPDVNITTGYIDRSVYDECPLTHNDFRNYLYNNYESSDYVFNKIYKLIKEVFMSLSTNICINKKLNKVVTFQLFGVDIALNDKLEPMIMEANKGPDLKSKDDRDSFVKYNCAEDILDIIGLIKTNKENGFIKIIDITKN